MVGYVVFQEPRGDRKGAHSRGAYLGIKIGKILQRVQATATTGRDYASTRHDSQQDRDPRKRG
ncbi:hypothetical protein E4U53_008083 [Claviceps sorghi]|nr:hypothetical protein E4U53_008083 [Claviceps sorghi]